MITEDYVSFEIAKLLKEKGFKEITQGYINTDKEVYMLPFQQGIYELSNKQYPYPTLQMAMKWLREKGHNIILTMLPKDDDCYVLWTFNIYSNKNYKIIWGELYEQPKYDTYEEAAEAAIKFCLTHNII